MKSYPTKFKSFLWKIVQMRTLQKLQNSIQTLVIFQPVYPIHTNSLFWVIFVELPFFHFPPPNTSIRGQDSKIQLIFHLNVLVFQTNGKQPYSFPVLSRFCNGRCISTAITLSHSQSAMLITEERTTGGKYASITRCFLFRFSTCFEKIQQRD